MQHGARYLSLISLVASLVFVPAAPAQQLGAMGELDRSIGGLDGGVRAEVGGQSRPASSGGSGAPSRTQSSMWSTKPGSGSWTTQSGANADERVGGWSPTRKSKQSATSRLSTGAAPSKEPMISSLGNKLEKPPPEKGVKPLLPQGDGGVPEIKPGPFELKGFTGKVRYSYSSSRDRKKRSREKIAKQLKGRGSPRFVSRRKQVQDREKPERDFLTRDDQGCDDASKLRLCTWFSSK